MARIQPLDPAAATGATKETFNSIQGALGGVPGMFRTVGQSPASLQAMWGFFGAMGQSTVPPAVRERIALAIGQANDCGYCLAAHSALAKKAGVADAEVMAARKGTSTDPKADAAVKFAVAILERKGHVSDADVGAVRKAGYSDAEVLEILSVVVQNVYTNWVNHVAQTAIDFPAAPALK